MDLQRILKNDLSILLSRSNEGKTNLLISIIKEYNERYKGIVYSFGIADWEKLGSKNFSSLLELENIRNSIVVIDEVGMLFDLGNRKERGLIEKTLRLVNHNGNKIIMSGLPTDFKKFLCAKAKCFLFKALSLSDLINGSLAKHILTQYKGEGLGVHTFSIKKDSVLIYDGEFYSEQVPYLVNFDRKRKNVNLFVEKK